MQIEQQLLACRQRRWWACQCESALIKLCCCCQQQTPALALHSQPPNPHLVALRLLLAQAAQAVLAPVPLDHLQAEGGAARGRRRIQRAARNKRQAQSTCSQPVPSPPPMCHAPAAHLGCIGPDFVLEERLGQCHARPLVALHLQGRLAGGRGACRIAAGRCLLQRWLQIVST